MVGLGKFSEVDHLSSFYRLGLWYALFRVIVAACLLLTSLSKFSNFVITSIPHALTFGVLALYTFVCLMQFMGYAATSSTSSNKRTQYIFYLGMQDVICFSLMAFVAGFSNYYVGSLFIITVFVVNMVQATNRSILITLTAIISVVYPPFIDYWFATNINTDFIGSFFLALILCSTAILARFLVYQFHALTKLNQQQSISLENSHELNQHILEKLTVGCIVFNSDTQPVLSNPMANGMLLPQGSDLEAITSNHPTLIAKLNAHKDLEAKKYSFDYIDDVLDVHVTAQKMHLNDEWLMVMLEDNSQINQRVHKLKLASLGQLTASIAHEIRNPLSTITQANDLILGADEEQVERLTNIVLIQSNRINSIIQSTLNLAKNQKPISAKIKLTELFDEIISVDLVGLSKKLSFNIEEKALIIFDKIHIKQIIVNLIQNANRHHNHDQNNPITVNVYFAKTQVIIDIIDFGKGVRESDIHNIFQPFFTTAKHGTGLGLYLCRNLCEANGAKISYIKLNIGCCFRVTCEALNI